MNNRTFILVFVATVFILGGLLYIYNPDPVEYKNPNEIEPTVCTQEAKLCPDGNYVSRSGPNCKFKACSPITGKKNIPKNAIMEDGTINKSDLPQ